MKASDILTLIPQARMLGPDRTFVSLKTDSRLVREGDAFIALAGSTTSGERFISSAISSGAALVICEQARAREATTIEVPDTTLALKTLLPVLYPLANRVTLIGVTGTSGKTTTTYLIESILRRAGVPTGVIGTIESRYAGTVLPARVTTPGPLELFEHLDTMYRAGVRTCVMEVSSHALDQDRPAGLSFAHALFTNLGQDHLDYHHDMQTYFAAKRKLFERYLTGRAIINTDDAYGEELARTCLSPVTYGKGTGAMIRSVSCEMLTGGMWLEVTTPAAPLFIRSRLLGEVHAYNILAAAALGLTLGIDADAICEGIYDLEKVPGRMEIVPNPYGRMIFVDYAHKPNALMKALESARSLCSGRVILVFGCGGDRDRAKRPIMGNIAEALADHVIVTSDNPRSEDPQRIMDEILAGVHDPEALIVEPDRAQAIRRGVAALLPDDCLLIAGKGHENYQLVGDERRPFDDKDWVYKALQEVYGS